MQYVSANDVAVAPGRAVYTQWLNSAGGIEADLTITRLAEDSFMVVTGAAAATRDLDWLRRHTPAEARVAIVDVTGAEAVLAVMGPAARDLLQALTTADLSAAAFPFGHAQEIDIGYVPVRAQRTSYVGELGFELYAPSEMAHGVFDRLRAAGADHGLRLAGYHVFDSCRIEKGFRHFGHDIGPDDTPLEAGLSFAVKFDKPASKFGPFIGREVLARQRDARPLTKRLVQFRLNDPAPLLYHLEPILRDGEIVGYLTRRVRPSPWRRRRAWLCELPARRRPRLAGGWPLADRSRPNRRRRDRQPGAALRSKRSANARQLRPIKPPQSRST